MKAEAWQKLKVLFDELVDLDEASQRQRLDALDLSEEMRNQLQNMLDGERASQDKAGLRTLVMDNAQHLLDTQLELTIGEQVGAYVITEVIGEGGMGIVYKAKRADDQFEHQVAIKIARQPGTDEAKDFERNVLAQLKHPNIAHIYDAGLTADGRGFLIMELIEGDNIAAYSRQQRLSLDDRFALFFKVCAAIRYAHQKGIMHRDIKPQNILIASDGGRAEPKVIDFGIAGRLTGLAENADANADSDHFKGLGTPAYMSPEQINHPEQVDTRADVYSLGLLLAELIAGVHPFLQDDSTVESVLKAKHSVAPSVKALLATSKHRHLLAEERQLMVTTLSRRLNDEFEAILIKATHPDQESRYASVADFVQDIQRWQKGYPVHALLHTSWYQTQKYRTKKFLSRNKIATAAVTTVAASLFAATGISLNALKKETEALHQAQFELEKSEAIRSFISDIFASVNPRERGINVKVMDLLDDAEDKLSHFKTEQEDVKAELLLTLGRSRSGLRQFEKAENNLKAALAIQEKQHSRGSLKVIEIYTELAEMAFEAGDLKTCLAISQDNVTAAKKTLGATHSMTMSNINNLASAKFLIARDTQDKALMQSATRDMQELLGLREKVLGKMHENTSHTRNNVANFLSLSGDTEAGMKVFEENLAIQKEIFGEGHYFTLDTMRSMGHHYFDVKDYEKAEAFFRTSFDGQLNNQPLETPITLFTGLSLMETLLDMGKREKAEGVAKRLEPAYRSGALQREGINKRLEAFLVEVIGENEVVGDKESESKPVVEK